jgi:putative hydrolase of the HAD superfamily
VFFDAGGTLLYPHPSFPELFAEILRGEGRDVEVDQVRSVLHLTARLFEDAAAKKELWSTSPERSRQFWRHVYTVMFEAMAVPVDDGIFQRLEREFTEVSNYRLFEDVLPALDDLQGHGVRLGLVSNFEEWLERLLEALEVIRYFDVRVISGSEGLEKPDPRIFEVALVRTGVNASESVYVGDSPRFDIEPAESIGMVGVLLDREGRFPDHPGIRISSLADLPDAIGLAA